MCDIASRQSKASCLICAKISSIITAVSACRGSLFAWRETHSCGIPPLVCRASGPIHWRHRWTTPRLSRMRRNTSALPIKQRGLPDSRPWLVPLHKQFPRSPLFRISGKMRTTMSWITFLIIELTVVGTCLHDLFFEISSLRRK